MGKYYAYLASLEFKGFHSKIIMKAELHKFLKPLFTMPGRVLSGLSRTIYLSVERDTSKNIVIIQ